MKFSHPEAVGRMFAELCRHDPDDRTSARRHAFVAALGLDPRFPPGGAELSIAEAAQRVLEPLLADLATLADAAVERAYREGIKAGQQLVAEARPGDLS